MAVERRLDVPAVWRQSWFDAFTELSRVTLTAFLVPVLLWLLQRRLQDWL